LLHEALMMIRGEPHYCNRHRAVFRRCGLVDTTVGTDSRNTKLLYFANGHVMR